MYDMVASLLDELRQGKAACMPKMICMHGPRWRSLSPTVAHDRLQPQQ